MNMDEILTLVQAVSDSKLTSFKLDQGDMHISLKKEKEEAKTKEKTQLSRNLLQFFFPGCRKLRKRGRYCEKGTGTWHY